MEIAQIIVGIAVLALLGWLVYRSITKANSSGGSSGAGGSASPRDDQGYR